MQALTQAVPTETAFDILRVQILWMVNHWAIVGGFVAGLWKLSRSIKKLPAKIMAPFTARMDAHERVDDLREIANKNAIAEARSATDEKWDVLKTGMDQLTASVDRFIRHGHSAD